MYLHKKYLLPIFIAFAISLLCVIQGCSVKKNTWAARQYHNTTARYNVYFNGYESYKEGVAELTKSHEDNYTMILPVYRYGDKDKAIAIFSQMDRAIEKASKAITKHSMVFKHQEYCKWIDDSYMLLGKAHFMKREFPQAIKTFDFVSKEFKNNPIKYDALLWLAKSYNYSGDLSSAAVVLSNLNEKILKDNISHEVLQNFHLVYADYYIRMKNYEAAIEQLEKSLGYKQKKQVKTRIHFILGQLYQQERQYNKASEHYKQVLRLNPPYEMAFNAKINLAQCYDLKSGQVKNIRKELEKMLKDEKNKEYADQIYYALAEIEIKEKDTNEAIRFLKLSVSENINNKYQKGISYLRLGEIHFNKNIYSQARIFYDSTVTYLPEDYPDYKDIKTLQINLADLVNNLEIIHLEDSLQRLASMPEKERKSIVDGIIKKIQEEEIRKKQEELIAQQKTNATLLDPSAKTQSMMSQIQNNWYFNNPQTMNFGYSEFIRKWGPRKLEDLWRLSNKQTMDFDFGNNLAEENEETNEDTLESKTFDIKNPETYLRQIPTTPEKINESNNKIIDALFNVGIIYRERIINLPQSAIYFEQLLSRYPDNKYKLSVYYYLYKIYADLKIKDKENKYKNLILQEFPESDFAQIILDPDYYKKIAAREDEAQNLYKTTYNLYKNNACDKVIENCDKAADLYKGHPIMVRFLYLKALCTGKTKSIDEFENALKKVVLLSPESETGKAAQNTLDFLAKKNSNTVSQNESTNNTNITSNKTSAPTSNYKINESDFHFFIILVDAKSGDINQLRNQISDHNKKYYSLEKLNITNILFNNNIQMITVSNFKNKETGMIYFNTVEKNNNLNTTLQKLNANKFIISAENYSIFYKQKDIENYKQFFNKNYLNTH